MIPGPARPAARHRPCPAGGRDACRPCPGGATFAGLAEHQREDGLFPYKLTASGPVFAQIQIVTPLARSVWTHYQLNGQASREAAVHAVT